MRKSSKSLLSMLAIAIGICSAFSYTKINAAYLASYEIYNLDPDVVPVSAGCPAFPGSAYDQNLATVFSNPIAQNETINQWITSNGPFLSINDFCIVSDADQLCLVKFKLVDGVLSDCLEFKAGDRIVQ